MVRQNQTYTYARMDNRGETLTETLVGLLIAALSIVMLSTAIASASRIIVTTRRTTETYRQATNVLMETPTDRSGPVSSVSITGGIYSDGSTENQITSADRVLPGGKTGVTYRRPSSAGEG